VLSKLGKYEIRQELGRGAMGIVYEGFDPFIERSVAIKTIRKSQIDHSEAHEALSRFRREAQAAGRLTHPNIAAVYEYGEDGDIAYIAMEYVVGHELKSCFSKGERFSIKDALHVMHQLLDALEYSHEHGVVHRDIKPSNIILTGNNQVKVVDFGIARIDSSELTQAGMVLGTPAYMSPEQFKGRPADRRSDIYSSGVILYHLLTGERPFIANSTTALMHKVLFEEAEAPSARNPEVSEALDAVVREAMAKEPEKRYQTAAEFRQALSLAPDTPAARAADTGRYEATRAYTHEGAPAITFDLNTINTHIEKHLNEARQEESLAEPPRRPSAGEFHISLPELTVEKANGSSLLSGLAREATARQSGPQTATQTAQFDRYSRAKRLHDALERISVFFNELSQQMKNVETTINRTYTFGRRVSFANLTCRKTYSDSRRRDIYDAVFLDYVMFSLNLSAPAPVLVTRSRDMLDDLKDRLEKYKMQPLDNLDALMKGPQQDWVEVGIAPDFPVQLQFKGNYEEGVINVLTLNLEAFGLATFKLAVEDVTPEFLDDMGAFLIGRGAELPPAMQRITGRK
jgi:serine/threonine protein kinase